MNRISHRVILAVVVSAGLSACSLASSGSDDQESAADAVALPAGLNPEPGTKVPQETVKVGLTPYGDELISVIGERQGYFEDAGITFTEPNGLKTDLAASLAPLLNGQIELGSGYMPVVTPQLDTVKNVRAFAISNVFLGNRILAPKGTYDTVDELMAEGSTFEEAASAVMKQLDGKTLLLPDGVVPTFYDLALAQADMTLGDVKTSYMGNPDIVRSAQAGKADFASPDGAVQITQLQAAGWEPLITIDQMVQALPDETVDLRTTHSAYLTTTDYAQDNYNTLVRYAGVVYRIIDDLQTDPVAAAGIYTDYLNSYTGSDLSPDEVAGLFTNGIYSLRGFDDATDFFGEPESPFTFEVTSQAQIASLKKGGVLKGDHDVADLSIAEKVYDDLVAYKQETEALMADLPDSELKEQAQTFYDAFNFIDAYRSALAASKA